MPRGEFETRPYDSAGAGPREKFLGRLIQVKALFPSPAHSSRSNNKPIEFAYARVD
jgi:hypothetical protein